MNLDLSVKINKAWDENPDMQLNTYIDGAFIADEYLDDMLKILDINYLKSDDYYYYYSIKNEDNKLIRIKVPYESDEIENYSKFDEFDYLYFDKAEIVIYTVQIRADIFINVEAVDSDYAEDAALDYIYNNKEKIAGLFKDKINTEKYLIEGIFDEEGKLF